MKLYMYLDKYRKKGWGGWYLVVVAGPGAPALTTLETAEADENDEQTDGGEHDKGDEQLTVSVPHARVGRPVHGLDVLGQALVVRYHRQVNL